ncbi:MAG TPA: ribosome maturation factor RimP [Thermoleophilia bacterium]|nr:ribosome maturation factor RimP [Thermoleophilia bacterium]
MREKREELEKEIEAALAARFPEVELVDLERRGQPAPTLTLYIDRPGGVDLDLCAAVSQALEDVRERYALEVSSPGLDRRLRKPEHFATQIGREVAVQMSEPVEGRRNFRGVLAAADQDSITLMLEGGGSVTLSLAALGKAHVVYSYETDGDGGQRE